MTALKQQLNDFVCCLRPLAFLDHPELAGLARERERPFEVLDSAHQLGVLVLKLGQLTDVVEVVANAAMVQPNAAVQTLMGPTQVAELPLNNRNFVQLASLVPGVNSSLADEVGIGLTSTVSVSMAGARRNGVNWLVDGASNVDVGSNITLLSTPSLESIEEFKIITSSYAAEWPRSGGGIVNVVTKSGSNTFRGSAYEFFRDDSLNANGFFRKQAGCVADGACSTDPAQVAIRENPAELKYHNFGYTFSGPITKDSLFFFFSQEFRRIDRAPTSTSASTVNPRVAGRSHEPQLRGAGTA